MPNSVFAEDVIAAREMIAEMGVKTTVRRVIPATYNPTGAQGAGSTTTAAILIVILPAKVAFTEGYEAQALIRQHHRRLIATFPAGVVWTLAPGDEVQFEGQWWKVRTSTPLNPDDKAVIFDDVDVEAT